MNSVRDDKVIVLEKNSDNKISNGVKVLMISTDRLIFHTGSDVRRRLLDYGALFAEIHVIVFSNKKLGHHEEQLTDNVFLYPTNSLNRLFYIWQAIKIGLTLLGRKGNWVITSQDPFETGVVALWFKWKKKIQWQAQIHTDFLSPFFAQESWLNWLRVRLAGFLLPRADKIRVVSLRIKKSLADWNLKTEPVVLPIFVSPKTEVVCSPAMDLHNKYPQFSFVILMASRLTVEKNFRLAIDAFAEVALDRKNVGLVIVGQGPEKEHLKSLAKTFRAGDQVIFEDWQSNLDCYYKTADLFMLTSNYEGYGRTIIEASLVGCPVLSTDAGLVGEVFSQDEILVCPVGDEKCLSEKLGWAIANHGQLSAMGERSRSKLGTFLSGKDSYLEAYRQSLSV